MSFKEGQQFSLKQIDQPFKSGIDFTKLSSEGLKDLWKDTLQKGMHGLCFSMYEDGQGPGNKITEAQVDRRMQVIKPYTKWVRSFSCIEGNEFIPRVAHKHGIKTLVGAWLGDDLEKK